MYDTESGLPKPDSFLKLWPLFGIPVGIACVVFYWPLFLYNDRLIIEYNITPSVFYQLLFEHIIRSLFLGTFFGILLGAFFAVWHFGTIVEISLAGTTNIAEGLDKKLARMNYRLSHKTDNYFVYYRRGLPHFSFFRLAIAISADHATCVGEVSDLEQLKKWLKRKRNIGPNQVLPTIPP